MVALIAIIVLTVLLIGATLYIFTKINQFKSLEEDYFDLVKKCDRFCKELDILRRENKALTQENEQLNKVSKTEKISKPRKTTTRKTTKK